MADEETISVANTAQLPVQINDLPENPDRPGDSPEPRRVVLNGARHPDAVHGVGITRNVPAAMFHAFLDRHPHLKAVLHPITDAQLDEHADAHKHYGWEPGLQAMADDPDHARAAGAGSTVTTEHVTVAHMTPTSDSPYDDSPRSQVRASAFQAAVAPPPPVAPVQGTPEASGIPAPPPDAP